MDDPHKRQYEERKIKFKANNNYHSNNGNKKWIVTMITISFLLSSFLSFSSSNILKKVDIFTALLVVLFIIFIGVIFDIVGVAVTAADEMPFHAMAAKKVYGAREAVKLIRNANRVSSICNDVVGDICGVISGAASALIVTKIAGENADKMSIVEVIIAGIVAAMTIGGKALGKIIALQKSQYIVYKVGVISKFFSIRINKDGRKKIKNEKGR